MIRNRRWCLTLVLVVLWIVPATAQERRVALVGDAIDAENGEPVAFVQILLEEPGLSTTSGANGRFTLPAVSRGVYTLRAFRVGYKTFNRSLEISGAVQDTISITISLSSSPVTADVLVVEGERQDHDDLTHPVMRMEGGDFRQNQGTTIAETIKHEPGISMRSMGPAPARPVLRGLDGERLLVLEDGGRTGDLSSTSADHAVVIDPATADGIELIRGPSALMFGSSPIGGVVNVVRGYVPKTKTEKVTGSVGGQVESVNSGYAASTTLSIPAGPFALRVDGSIRNADDVRTPEGTLKNTAIETYNGSAGGSYVGRYGYVGGAAAYYYTDYGIPGGFVGAHPGGATVQIDRRHYELKSEFRPHSTKVSRIHAQGTYSRYLHKEFESSGNLGVEFGLLSYHGKLIAHTLELGPFSRGAIGIWGEYRDYASAGFVFTPASLEGTVAGFAYQEALLGPLQFQAGLRYDYRKITPSEEGNSSIGFIRTRDFGGASASVLGHLNLGKGYAAGISAIRTIRMPSLEELYSEGPHLAAFAFEVGDPDLESERGLGLEVFGHFDGSRTSVNLFLFGNFFENYIFPRATGELDPRLLLPVFQTTGQDARMIGGEFQASFVVSRSLTLDGSAAAVRGTFNNADEPMPWIPPLTGRLGVRYTNGPVSLRFGVSAATAQNRTAPFEQATAGFTVAEASAQYHFSAGGLLHTVDLSALNLTDRAYRDHLSRTKSITPEPGRNIRLLYKLHF
jgi:iron complex outermembrane receptor protein